MHGADFKRLLMEYISGLVLSVFGFLIFVGLHNLLLAIRVNIGVGGDKAKIFMGLFLGLPFGSILGILLVDRYVYCYKQDHYINFVIAFILGILGAIIGVIMLDKVGGQSVIAIPIVVTGLCLLGFNRLFIF